LWRSASDEARSRHERGQEDALDDAFDSHFLILRRSITGFELWDAKVPERAAKP
jgi:hypothetical protein